MKIISYLLPVVVASAALAGFAAARANKSDAQVLKTFGASDKAISKDLVLNEKESAWSLDAAGERTFRLFEVPDPGVEDCMVIYRAKLKTEGLEKPAYLEMWCRITGRGEFFSRGLDQTVTGSNDWASYETPFFLKRGEKPDLIKLNLVTRGAGKIWIKDVELLKAPLPPRK